MWVIRFTPSGAIYSVNGRRIYAIVRNGLLKMKETAPDEALISTGF